ncbi:MAG: DUF2817 domain-containing protein [Planctomycetes bacterium]|nr:DUF2817 domain-containing protein [Planctomycetota bacterium]
MTEHDTACPLRRIRRAARESTRTPVSSWKPLALATFVVLGACAPISDLDVHRYRGSGLAAETVESRSHDDAANEAESTNGRTITARSFGDGSRTILLLGAIHGDEPGSHLLVRDIEDWVRRRPEVLRGLRLVSVSPVNPDGLEQGTRRNARGVDLNRNFPSRNFEPGGGRGPKPLSEPESRFLHQLLLRYDPALVLSVHQPRHSVNWDGPAEDLARAMAERCGYRAEATVGYSTPGSLGSYQGIDRARPIITLELGRHPAAGKTFFEETEAAIEYAFAWTRSFGAAGPDRGD